MSRIRANQITNQSADGAPTVQNGLVISGVTTSTTFSGSGASLTNIPSAQLTGALPALDGSNLTGITQTTINNNANNRIITGSGSANTLEGEATLTFTNSGSAGQLNLKRSTSTDQEAIFYYGSSNLEIETREATGIKLKTNKSDRVTITSAGDVKIKSFGNASNASADALQIGKTDNNYGITILSATNAQGRIDFTDTEDTNDPQGKIAYYHDSNSLQFFTNGGAASNERLRITNTGHTLFSGLTAHNDPRNAKGITVKSTDGVSFQNYGSNGSRNWRIRPDDMSRWGDLDFSVSPTANSATDWPDAAADKVLTLGYDGQVSKPRQASFAAMKSGNQYSLNNEVFPFNTTTHNVGNHFNTSNYRFTAPVAGRYLFTFYSILNSSGQGRYEILINGSADQNGTRVHMTPNTSNWDHVSTSWILNLAANDYIQMYSQTNTGWHGGHWQRFCGELLS